MGEERFDVSQAETLVDAFQRENVEFLFIGKGAAILMGYPSTTLDVDLIHAPDGLPEYGKVKARSIRIEKFPLVCLADIIASKEATGRQRDRLELPLLRAFQRVYEQEQQRSQSHDQQQQEAGGGDSALNANKVCSTLICDRGKSGCGVSGAGSL